MTNFAIIHKNFYESRIYNERKKQNQDEKNFIELFDRTRPRTHSLIVNEALLKRSVNILNVKIPCELLVTQEKDLIYDENGNSSEYHKLYLMINGAKMEMSEDLQKRIPVFKIPFDARKGVNLSMKMDHFEKNLHKDLSQIFQSAILNFISKGGAFPEYCCFDFFFNAHGFYSDGSSWFAPGRWQYKQLNETLLKSGDGIVVYDKNLKWVHSAIYLVNRLYLSVFGSGGPLIVADLDEMKKIFNGYHACEMVPCNVYEFLIVKNKLYLIENHKKIEMTQDFQENLHKSNTYFKVHSQIRILIKMQNFETISHVYLSDTGKRAIVNFIINGGMPGYSNVDFFLNCHGYFSETSICSFPGRWEIDELKESSLNSGDGIVILDANNEPIHFAIYLDEGIYLFVLRGSLVTASLEEMMNSFKGNLACRLEASQNI